MNVLFVERSFLHRDWFICRIDFRSMSIFIPNSLNNGTKTECNILTCSIKRKGVWESSILITVTLYLFKPKEHKINDEMNPKTYFYSKFRLRKFCRRKTQENNNNISVFFYLLQKLLEWQVVYASNAGSSRDRLNQRDSSKSFACLKVLYTVIIITITIVVKGHRETEKTAQIKPQSFLSRQHGFSGCGPIG